MCLGAGILYIGFRFYTACQYIHHVTAECTIILINYELHYQFLIRY
jgi:hypothetical protein